MKYISKIVLSFSLIALIVGCTEDESVITQVDDGVVRGAILRTIEVDPLNFDLRDPDRPWNLTVEMEDNNQGDLLDFVEVYVTFFDNTPENGDNPVERQLVTTIPASEFAVGPVDLPRTGFDLTLPEVTQAAGLNDDQVEGGDVFRVELELNLTDGRVYTKDDVNGGVAGGSFFQSPFQYRLTIVGCPPRPGVYTIEMTDDFGDGWQSTTADDGPGIQVFGDGELLGEFGICTSYNSSMDSFCTGSGSSGSASFEMPDGITDATWTFPGDFWGEMGFTIFYNGEEGLDEPIEIYSAGPGTQSEGEFFVVLCRLDD